MQKNKFDIHQTPEGHFERFKDKLNIELTQYNKKTNHLKWYLVAASLALLVSLWYNFKPQDKFGYELADVSEQMKETQTYFTSVLTNEIKKVNIEKNKTNDKIVVDALSRVELLENEYTKLSIELKNTGFDKRVINAMIFNFQQRIEIVQDLLEQIEKIKTTQDENNKYM